MPIANHLDPVHSVAGFGLTDTLIGDADGIYHPALFNDRLLLGLKGTMSEAELPAACPAARQSR